MSVPIHNYSHKPPAPIPTFSIATIALCVHLMQNYDLTCTEAKFAVLLADGFTVVQSGQILGLTESSVRTLSKHVYAKTYIHTSAQLVSFICKLVIDGTLNHRYSDLINQ